MSTQKEFSDNNKLLSACVKKDRRAQKTLYELYSPKMLAVCIRYIGQRERAMDILHDGFITVFEKIGSYNGTGSFEGWLRRIFVNTALMDLRKSDLLKFSDELSDTSIKLTSHTDTLSGINSKELLRLIASMPLGFRTVFNMYAIEGHSHKEIAKELKISEGTSRSQLSRARIWLQDRIERG